MAETTIKYSATGRRKTAVARVELRAGSGKCVVNKVEFKQYFPVEAIRNFIVQPLKITDTLGKYDVAASISGGGTVGQAGALRHSLARALLQVDGSLREVLKGSGLLTRDARMKERKKYGQRGARRRFQFSKR